MAGAPFLAEPRADGDSVLRRLALSTLFPAFGGTAMPPRLGWLAGQGLGGVLLSVRNIDPRRGVVGVVELADELRDAGLIVTIDEKGGDAIRPDAASGAAAPGEAALGAPDDPVTTGYMAVEFAHRLRATGIDVNLAPAANLDTDAALLARHVTCSIREQQRQGVAATVTHFPGRQRASGSNATAASLDPEPALLREYHLPPFRSAIDADVKVVMAAHHRVPAIDRRVPAALSHRVVTGLLREELGYDGVVMTGELDAATAGGTGRSAPAAVLALLAGADALCVGNSASGLGQVEAIAEAIVDAVLAGRLPATRLAEASARIQALRDWCDEPAPVEQRHGAGASHVLGAPHVLAHATARVTAGVTEELLAGTAQAFR